ncbi:MAG: rRNA pseudouridine synthase [Coriobacteriales bacterium]|nr:rRNA pseudouridine synthase [Coriobacteriales bacterium]
MPRTSSRAVVAAAFFLSESEQLMSSVYPLRLQKFLARAGVASRRGSENLMTAGRVTVNGVVADHLGSKIDPNTDEVRVDGRLITLADTAEYLMLNKPAYYLTTMSDPQGRPCVASLLPEGHAAGLFPVGRLDYDTTGLLLFMTDGELAHRLLHPRHHVPKCYIAELDGVCTEEDAQRLREGVVLTDGRTAPAVVEILNPGQDASLNSRHLRQLKKPNTNERIRAAAGELPVVSTRVALTITEGRKRQIKRMCAHVGRPVLRLHREAFGPLELGSLPPGECRALTDEELAALRAAAGI